MKGKLKGPNGYPILSPYAKDLGTRFTGDVKKGFYQVELTIGRRHTNHSGRFASGAVIGGLLDDSLGAALLFAPLTKDRWPATITITPTFLRPVKVGDVVTALAYNDAHSERFAWMSGKLVNQDKTVVAAATGIWVLKKK